MQPPRTKILLTFGALALTAVTAVVFVAFDRGSHSASDTLRPFLLIMVPAWAIALGSARLIVDRGRRASPGDAR